MGLTVGMVTHRDINRLHLDPRHFGCARSYLKALGLNLKEKSSGKTMVNLTDQTRLGAGTKVFIFAALRLINSNPVIRHGIRTRSIHVPN